MIKKLDIAKFGLFNNYLWDNCIGKVETFRKLNIIYGRNYSGKTTLSRIFRCIETNALHPKYLDVVADAKICTLKDERQVVNFSIAINDSYKQKGSSEVKRLVRYFKCAYWLSADIAKYLTKGTLVELSGRIGIDAYKDLQGEAKASLTLHVNNIKLHSKGIVSSAAQAAPAAATDDLPF